METVEENVHIFSPGNDTFREALELFCDAYVSVTQQHRKLCSKLENEISERPTFASTARPSYFRVTNRPNHRYLSHSHDPGAAEQ